MWNILSCKLLYYLNKIVTTKKYLKINYNYLITLPGLKSDICLPIFSNLECLIYNETLHSSGLPSTFLLKPNQN